MAPTQAEKIRENRLRSAAARQGFRLIKSSRRDPLATGYGRWLIADAATGRPLAGELAAGLPAMSLDEVERWLTDPASR